MSALVRRHPSLTFFALAFAFAWAILVPMTLASWGLVAFPSSPVLLIAMAYGPTLAALIVSGLLGGRAAVRELLARLLIWRVGWRWYAVALGLNAGIILGALGLYALLGGEVPAGPVLGPGLLLDILATFVVVTLINGEEVGWRGFALPRLIASWGLPAAIVGLGVIEAVFHLPIFLANGPSEAGGQNGAPFAAFVASSILAVVLFTWMYAHTRGSLLLAILLHGSMNTWSNVLPFPASSTLFFWCLVAIQAVVALAVIVEWRRHAAPRQLRMGLEYPGLRAGRPRATLVP